MINKNLIFVLLIACLISPVMAETIYFNDSIDMSTGIYTDGSGGGRPQTVQPCLTANEITALMNVATVSIKISDCYLVTSSVSTDYYYPEVDELSNYYPFTLTTSTGYEVGSGTALLTYRTAPDNRGIGADILLSFDSYDIGDLTGKQILRIGLTGFDYTKVGLTPATYLGYQNPGSLTSGFYYTNTDGSRSTTFDVTIQTDVKSEFSQILTYDYDSNTKILDFDYNRDGINNNVVVTGYDESIYYTQTTTDNIGLSIYNNTPVTFDIDNILSDTDWCVSIPETSTSDPSPSDPAEFTAYIYDAQTGNLISWSCLNKTYSGEYALPSSTYDPDGVIQAVAYWDETDWALFTASATGYKPDTTEFNYTAATAPPGSSTQMIFHLVPDGSIGNGSYALSFKVSQEISPTSELWTRSVDATVICDGEQHLTGPTGTTWFNVSAGDHPYTVSKNGFETVQGTVTVSGNMLQSVYLNLGPDTPTVDDPTGNESGEVGDEDMHTAVAEAYAQFGAFIPEAVMIACVLFLLSMFKKF